MRTFPFQQVNVFSQDPLRGNPLAVVLDAQGIDDARMAAFAHWTNLSETTFLLPPTDPQADYRVRIFTTLEELPFAGHPTLGSCHAWLAQGGVPKGEEIVQECGIGLVRIRRSDAGLAFLAPPLLRGEALAADLRERVRRGRAWRPRTWWTHAGPTTAPAGSRCGCAIVPRCWRSSRTMRS